MIALLPHFSVGVLMSTTCMMLSTGSVLTYTTGNIAECWDLQCGTATVSLKIKVFDLEVPRGCASRCCNNLTVVANGRTRTICDRAMGDHTMDGGVVSFALNKVSGSPAGAILIEITCGAATGNMPSLLGGTECESSTDYNICPMSGAGYCYQSLCTSRDCSSAPCPVSSSLCDLRCVNGYCQGRQCTSIPTDVPTAVPVAAATGIPQTYYPATSLPPQVDSRSTSAPLTGNPFLAPASDDNETLSLIPTPFYLDEDYPKNNNQGSNTSTNQSDIGNATPQPSRLVISSRPINPSVVAIGSSASDGGLKIALGVVILLFILGGVAISIRSWRKDNLPTPSGKEHNLYETSHLWKQRLENQRSNDLSDSPA